MSTKYIVLLGDGMTDYPVPELDNKTPLQYADSPNMDKLAHNGVTGMVKTVPEGLPPASDVANLSVMGYDPLKYYTGRSPLEAVSMGINLSDNDVAFRCNLVTLSDEKEYENKFMIDHSSDEISNNEAKILIEEIKENFQTDTINFYPGISYRHCMVWKNGKTRLKLVPPHDILGKKINKYMPAGEDSSIIKRMMIKSYSFLSNSIVNKKRDSAGLNTANSIWLWGEGKKPDLPLFFEKYKKSGSVISAVDLIKGIGICAGLKVVNVKGATGNIHTDFNGKANAALNELSNGSDFVYIHVEAPDECGHRYEIENKVKSIEFIDKKILGTLLEGLKKYENYRILVLPDHPTPLTLRTHTREPVPFIIYDNNINQKSGVSGYDEIQFKEKKVFIEKGYELLDMFLNTKS